MNAILLKWLSMSLISTVVLCALWLAGSVQDNNSPRISDIREAVAVAPVLVVAEAR